MRDARKFSGTLVLIAIFLLFVFQPWGFLATRVACSESGGVSISQTFDTNGYFYGTGDLNCYGCFYQFGAGAYDYIDIHYTRPANARGAPPTGFLRFEVLTAPDERCDWWFRSPHAARAERQYGLKPGACVGRYPIQEHEVSRFEVRRQLHKPVNGILGVNMRMLELEILDRESNERIARAREFRFINSLTKALGNSSPTYSCPGISMAIISSRDIQASVLNDPNGEPFEVAAARYVKPQPEAVTQQVPDEPMTFSGDAPVHAVGVYRAKPVPGRRPTYSGIPDSGDVNVTVTGSGKIILVLSAHDPVRWHIRAQSADIEHVLVFAYHEQQVVGLAPSTRVYVNPWEGSSQPAIYAFEEDARFVALDLAVHELTGQSIATFQGDYDAAEFVVRSGSNNVR